MRRSAEDALLPSAGDQLPEDPRPSKAVPQPTKTRTITVHNLPIEGCEDGVTSLQFEVLSDGIIDDVKKCISERLTNERFYLPRRLFHLQSGGVHQPFFKQLKGLERFAELTFQGSVVELVD